MSFGSFWATVELLVTLEASSKAASPFEEALGDAAPEDWHEDVSDKLKMRLKRASLAGCRLAASPAVEQREDAAERSCSDNDDSRDYRNLLECSFAYSPVRSRLEQLMGSSVVRLTERRYMLKLMSRIRQEHETQQQARIQERKTRELMRTKKMILNRLIPVDEAPTEIREYPLFQLYLYCDAIIERRRKKQVSKKVRISRSLFKLLYPERPDESSEPYDSDDDEYGEEEGDMAEEVPMKEILIDGVPTLVPMSKEEIEQAAKEKELAEEISNGYMFSKEEYDNLHYEADAVKKLKETRTVDEMYAKAHEIVGLLYSLAGSSDKRKRCTINEQKNERQDEQDHDHDDDQA